MLISKRHALPKVEKQQVGNRWQAKANMIVARELNTPFVSARRLLHGVVQC